MKVSKSKVNGWVAEDTVRFGNTETGALELQVYTSKSNGHLITRAVVSHIKNGWRSHTLYQDFNKVLLKLDCKRVTEKSVTMQQSWVDINKVLLEAQAHYGLSHA